MVLSELYTNSEGAKEEMSKEFRELLEAVAKQNNTTADEVYKEMQIAIDAGFDNPDPEVQKMWKQIPFKGERPTPEEVIPYVALKAKAGVNKGWFH